MTRVAVVIPCYRDARTLGSALDSVHAQTRPVDEVIVVDDCSPEGAAIERVLERHPSVRYIRNSANLGLAASRNVGVRAMTADVASFLDADDLLHPQKIELQLSVYSPDIAVSCRFDRIPHLGEAPPVRVYRPDFEVSVFSDSRKLLWRNRLTGAALMISRELLLRHGGYDERFRSCEDFDLWLRLLDSGVRAVDVRLPLYRYRSNPAGLSRNDHAISTWELAVVGSYLRRHDPAFPARTSGAVRKLPFETSGLAPTQSRYCARSRSGTGMTSELP